MLPLDTGVAIGRVAMGWRLLKYLAARYFQPNDYIDFYCVSFAPCGAALWHKSCGPRVLR
jgi:hypothetical protein